MKRLTAEDRQEIIALHKKGESIRYLSRVYDVSRGTIRFTVNPEAAEKNRVNNRERMREKRGNTKVQRQDGA